MRKPNVFIGASSTEDGVRLAKAIKTRMYADGHENVNVFIWHEGVFDQNRSIFECLNTTILNEYDYGIFLLTPDDYAIIQNNPRSISRDNVIFELGLFLGKKGPSKSFIVAPNASPNRQFRVASDLTGVNTFRYDYPISVHDKELAKDVDHIAYKILNAINSDYSDTPTTIDRLESLYNKLSSVASTLGTRSIGQFPAYLPVITSQLASARSKINIAVDFLTYGFFSAPGPYDQYKTALIQAARRDIECSALCLDRGARINIISSQFGKGKKEWDSLAGEPEFARRLVEFSKWYSKPVENRSDFIRATHRAQKQATAELTKAGVMVRYYNREPFPVHLWIIDESSAVFTIPRLTYGHYAREHGFITTDLEVVKNLMAMWSYFWPQCKE